MMCIKKKYKKIDFIVNRDVEIYILEKIDKSIFNSEVIHEKIIITGVTKIKGINNEYFNLNNVNKFDVLENINMIDALERIQSMSKGYFYGAYGFKTKMEMEIYIDSISLKDKYR